MAGLIGVVAAMAREERIARRAARAAGVGARVRVTCSGIGPERARVAAERLLREGASLLVSTGYAGALSDAVREGDLLLAEWVSDASGERLHADPAGLARLAARLTLPVGVHTAGVATVDRPVSTRAERARLAERAGALAVDMESAAIAAAACAAGVPFVVIRSISDAVDRVLPPVVREAMDARGRVRGVRFLGGLCRHPHELVPVLRLARGAARAGRTLDAALPGGFAVLAEDVAGSVA